MAASTRVERYEAKVDRTTTPDGCHPWTASLRRGYGAFWDGKKHWTAHRWGWTRYVGPIPDGLVVRHACDYPRCVNIDHLLLGTHADNIADMFKRGRQSDRRGELGGNAKLTAQEAVSIHEEYARGVMQDELADRYGVSQATISRIVTGINWSHLGVAEDEYVLRGPRGTTNGNAKLTDAAVLAICAAHDRGGVLHRELAVEYGVTRCVVSEVLSGRSWSHVTGRSYVAKKSLA